MARPGPDRIARAQLQRLEALDELLPVLAGVLDVRDVFDHLSAIARRVLPHDMLLLTLLTEDREHADVHAVTGHDMAVPTRIALAHMTPLAARRWDSLIVPDMQRDPHEQALPPGQAGYRSRLVVPIRLQGEHVGALDFVSRTVSLYEPADVLVAHRIADHVALALAHQRLADEAARLAEASERAQLLERRVTLLTAEVDALGGQRRVVGTSPAWQEVLRRATQVAATDTTVLLVGESGTGKEVISRFIHRGSPRSASPFVAFNCAAPPEQRFDSELFGHERDAIPGAPQAQPGQIELAAGGTLLLDEVGSMPLAAQAKLLRVLQEREFQRVGGTRTLRANVRVIAATSRDLHAAVARGAFREDLYYRLDVFEIPLPPLRERRDDILPLSEAFLADIGASFGRPPAGISREARALLLDYHWPGNVRQLRNALERAAILCEGGLILGEHLSLPPRRAEAPAVTADTPSGAPPPSRAGDTAATRDLGAMERQAIEDALREARHNKAKAARMLGLSRTQLYVRLRRYGLEG